MYGYGDVLNPDDDTVDVLEDMLLMFWGDLCMKSLAVSSTGRVRIGDVTFVLRKDARKLGRVLELIALEKELAKARNTLGADVTVKGAGAKEFTSTTTTAAGSRSQDADDDFNDLSDDPDFIIPPLPSAQAQAQAKKDDDFDDIMLE
ncbi:Transcription initiation factor TFIID subunit 13 [Entophlyctis luteolus]|nr:Transcription initiation factor TFIID subunit 13 [Entophlyctis luteolus]KAJ3388611.1 Transcription initiation factor TFIID subunit 13 [Entophlyctis sp. JEL0112]